MPRKIQDKGEVVNILDGLIIGPAKVIIHVASRKNIYSL